VVKLGSIICTNEKVKTPKFQQKASVFARQVLGQVGGSCVYIAGKKFVDTEDVTKKL